MTAWENLKSDFYWLPDATSWFAEIAPAVAIVWAVYAYFGQRKNDREHQLNIEKRALFGKTISLLSDCWALKDFTRFESSVCFVSLLSVQSQTKILTPSVEIEKHLENAIAALRNRAASIEPFHLDPTGSGGHFLGAKTFYSTKEIGHWPTSRSVFDAAVTNLLIAMRQETSSSQH